MTHTPPARLIPSLPNMARTRTRTRSNGSCRATTILSCHRAIRLELSLSGSVGPFASLMIAPHAV